MKISEFAEQNNITTKMLRHYDEIGLFKPSAIDRVTGYRSYEESQSNYLNWIIILKNLEFSLSEIKEMLSGPMNAEKLVYELKRKRIEISSTMNETIQKKYQIDKLIKVLEKEGFQMDQHINLLNIEKESVHEIKKNMPNMEMFLETVNHMIAISEDNDNLTVIRFDISHFKQVNDDYGFDVGDNVIVACYSIIKDNIAKLQKMTNLQNKAAIGRAHGDEFVVFLNAAKEEAEEIMQSIVKDIELFDFSTLGCNQQMGCYLGALYGNKITIPDIRLMIENSIEVINEARKAGRNSIAIEQFKL